jgi:hypothetical protein
MKVQRSGTSGLHLDLVLDVLLADGMTARVARNTGSVPGPRAQRPLYGRCTVLTLESKDAWLDFHAHS